MSNSTANGSRGTPGKKAKPQKPADKQVKLRVHKASGQWCKQYKGTHYYLGKVKDDPDGSEAHRRFSVIREGKADPGPKQPELAADATVDHTGNILLGDLCNEYITYKKGRVADGRLSPLAYRGYFATCQTVCEFFGRNTPVADLRPRNFAELRSALARGFGKTKNGTKRKGRGPLALSTEIIRTRMIFNYGHKCDEQLLPTLVRFGSNFDKPEKKSIRAARNAHKAKHGRRMFEADELKKILVEAQPALKAMVLLGANCGFGQTDISNLPTRAVDLEKGWVDFPRVKTQVERRIPLWPETVEAIREWQAVRPKAKDRADADLMFLTCRGTRWIKVNQETGQHSDAVSGEFNKLLVKLGIKRERVGFYALRHGFETIGGDSTDQVAVDAIMGHAGDTMAENYREGIDDARLQKVVDHVRAWLFAK